MRTIIDLPESQLAALRELEARKKVSRAELIRQAVAQYVVRHTESGDAFGVWKTAKRQAVDGLTVQKKLRAEWDR
jgi:metal-responsive CopG/Arc/MetJ family transcriptional regulator